MTEFLIGYHIVQPGKMALQHLHSKVSAIEKL